MNFQKVYPLSGIGGYTFWHMSGKLRLCLLGILQLEREGKVIAQFQTQKFGRLLAYLALFPNRTHFREELVGLFWPESDAESGRTNLRSTLSALRRQLDAVGIPGEGFLETEWRDVIRLNPDACATDVREFEAALKMAEQPEISSEDKTRYLQQAVDLYGGPLLPGLYDAWALTERDRLTDAYIRALHGLTTLAAQRDDLSVALSWARKAVAVDPLREESHAEVIRLLIAGGDKNAAQKQFDRLARILEEHYDARPSASIAALLKARGEVPAPATLSRESPRTPEASPRRNLHLPADVTPFIGREEETGELNRLLRDPSLRLLTLTGAGGSGKTRLAIETARQTASYFTSGSWFVPLAEVRDAERLLEAIARALGIPDSPDVLPLRRIIATLRHSDAPLLLTLDNFEQLADDTASVQILYALLEAIPQLTLLVTSRQRLLLQAEQEFIVAPMPTPAHPGTLERIQEFTSVQLFVDRAKAAHPDFQLTPTNAGAVAELCRRLEGIPLAIELAAAWSGVLSPAQLEERLDKSLALLVSRRQNLSGRQGTLRATIQWSWDLLSEDLRRFFARLTVFRGGWTLEAAEAVTDTPNALLYLAELKERSLLFVSEDTSSRESSGVSEGTQNPPAMRFRMLETLHEFASEKLRDSTERHACAQRHFRYFHELAETAYRNLRGTEQAEWLRLLDVERDNLRGALEYGLSDHGDSEAALALAGALVRFWRIRGPYREGIDWLQRSLERTKGPMSPARSRALRALGWLAWRIHAYEEAVAASTEGLELCRQQEDPRGAAFCLSILGMAAHHNNETERAQTLLDESVALARSTEDRAMVGHCLFCAGMILVAQGNNSEARRCLEEAIYHLDAVGDGYQKANALRSLGNLLLSQGKPDAAKPLLEDAIYLFQQLGDTGAIGRAHMVLGFAAFDTGDYPSAHTHIETALHFCREVGDSYGVAHAYHNLGHTSMARGDYRAARDNFRHGLRLFQDLGYRADIALSLEGLARLSLRLRDWERALVLLGAAEMIRALVGVPLPAVHQERIENELAELRQVMDAESVALARAQGNALSVEHSCAFALGAPLPLTDK